MAVDQKEQNNRATAPNPWIGYVAPMAVFMAMTALEGMAQKHYVWLYMAKAVVVTALLLVLRRPWADIRPSFRVVPVAVFVGLAVFAEWVLIDQWVPYPRLGTRSAFDPYRTIADPATRALFLAVRFYGLVLMVPVMEELFWRSFLLRWFTRPDFEAVAVGVCSGGAFWAVVAGFGLAHPEWLVAIICAAAYGGLLVRTRSLFACIVAHAVTNLALGIYVVTAHAWRYW